MKRKLLGFLPGVRWVPHDIPRQEHGASAKPKARHRFKLKSSSSALSAGARPDHGALRPRKSTLSLTSEPDPELDARTHAQGQSVFFARLPIELRRMVYEYVVGSETVHLTLSAKRKFGHFICDGVAVGLVGEDKECGCRVLVGGREGGRLDGACARMLRVCRRMYSEAVTHLYRPHTFSILHITHLLYLPTRLPQPRLDTIRTLRLRWAIRALPYLRRGNRLAYREDTANWERAWAILASMQGLRDLHVVLVDPSPQDMWERNWMDLEEELLASVKGVVRPRWFELVLPYNSCETEWDMGDCAVRLRTPDDGNEAEEEAR